MKNNIKFRVIEEANIIINTNTTLRSLSRRIGVSKSTIHSDMRTKLKNIDKDLYLKVNQVFLEHIKTRHYLGGLATQKKYKKNTIKP